MPTVYQCPVCVKTVSRSVNSFSKSGIREPDIIAYQLCGSLDCRNQYYKLGPMEPYPNTMKSHSERKQLFDKIEDISEGEHKHKYEPSQLEKEPVKVECNDDQKPKKVTKNKNKNKNKRKREFRKLKQKNEDENEDQVQVKIQESEQLDNTSNVPKAYEDIKEDETQLQYSSPDTEGGLEKEETTPPSQQLILTTPNLIDKPEPEPEPETELTSPQSLKKEAYEKSHQELLEKIKVLERQFRDGEFLREPNYEFRKLKEHVWWLTAIFVLFMFFYISIFQRYEIKFSVMNVNIEKIQSDINHLSIRLDALEPGHQEREYIYHDKNLGFINDIYYVCGIIGIKMNELCTYIGSEFLDRLGLLNNFFINCCLEFNDMITYSCETAISMIPWRFPSFDVWTQISFLFIYIFILIINIAYFFYICIY